MSTEAGDVHNCSRIAVQTKKAPQTAGFFIHLGFTTLLTQGINETRVSIGFQDGLMDNSSKNLRSIHH